MVRETILVLALAIGLVAGLGAAPGRWLHDAAANTPPEAVDDSASPGVDTPIDIAVLANDSDPDGDAATVAAVEEPDDGTASLNDDGTVTDAPNAGVIGSDSFEYTIVDTAGGSADATVTIDIGGASSEPEPSEPEAGDPPVAQDDAATTAVGTPLVIAVLANDVAADGSAVAVAEIPQGANGAVSINEDGTVNYAPNAGFVGTDGLGYTVVDSGGNTATATATATATGTNTPVATATAAQGVATATATATAVVSTLPSTGAGDRAGDGAVWLLVGALALAGLGGAGFALRRRVA